MVFYIYYFIMFMGQSINNGFLSLFFKDAGMDPTQIGWLFGIAPLAGLLAQPLIGGIADRSKSKNMVLIAIIICNIVAVLLFQFNKSLIILSLIMIFFTGINNCLVPVQDTITLDYVNKNGGNYAPVRMSGTLGFAIMATIVGPLISDNPSNMMTVYLVVLVAMIFSACFLPSAPGYRKKGEKPRFLKALKDRELRLVLFAVMFMYGTQAFNNTFMGPYIIDHGGTTTDVGMAICIRALSEIPFYIGRGRQWVAKMGLHRMLTLCLGLHALRWLLMGVWPNPIVIILCNLLHGVAIVVMAVAVVQFINDHMPPELKASGQMLMSVFSVVLARALGNILGGVAVGALNGIGLDGAQVTFIAMSPLSIIMIIICGLPLMRIYRRRKEQSAAL